MTVSEGITNKAATESERPLFREFRKAAFLAKVRVIINVQSAFEIRRGLRKI